MENPSPERLEWTGIAKFSGLEVSELRIRTKKLHTDIKMYKGRFLSNSERYVQKYTK